jgi:hypothetical protein
MLDYIKDNVSVLCKELGNLSDFFVQIHNITIDNDKLPTELDKIKAVMKLKVINEEKKKERFLNKHLAKYILDSYKMINFKKKAKMMNKQIEERKVIRKIHNDSKKHKKVYVDLAGGGKVEVPEILLGGAGKAAMANYEKVRLYKILKQILKQDDINKVNDLLDRDGVTLNEINIELIKENVTDLTTLTDDKKLFTPTYFKDVVKDFKEQFPGGTEPRDLDEQSNELSETYKKNVGFNDKLIKLNKSLRAASGGKDLTSMKFELPDAEGDGEGAKQPEDGGPEVVRESAGADDDDDEVEVEVKQDNKVDPRGSGTVHINQPTSVSQWTPQSNAPRGQPALIPPKLPPIKPLTASRPSSTSPGMLGTCGQCNNCLACLPYMLNYTLFSEFYRPLKIMDILLMAFSVFPFIGWYFDIVMIFKALVERRYIYAIYSSINLYQWFFWRMFGLHIDWGPMIKILYIGAVGSDEFTIDYISNMLFGGIYNQLQNLRGAIAITPHH